MTHGWRLRIFPVTALLLLLGLIPCVSYRPSSEASGNPSPADVGPDKDTAHSYFTNLPLVTHTGETVHFFTDMLQDRIVLISGFYIHCDSICPRQNMILSRLQKVIEERLGRDVFMVSITVDPQRDDPAKVREYAMVWDPQPGWTFLTGKPENVNWVNFKLGQYYEDPEIHKGAYLLGNLKTGLWIKAPPQSQVEDLYRRVLKLIEDTGEDKE